MLCHVECQNQNCKAIFEHAIESVGEIIKSSLSEC